MSFENELKIRSASQCELCAASENLSAFAVPPATNNPDRYIYICDICKEQIENPDKTHVNHWRCLNESMWSQVPAVQVMIWRQLNHLRDEGWPQDLLDMLYLDEETQAWAEATGEGTQNESALKHSDSNGAILETGDTVTLIKDLKVKGTNFTAKRGSSVRGISLVSDNAEHIEGKINGQQIVILTKFVKKTS